MNIRAIPPSNQNSAALNGRTPQHAQNPTNKNFARFLPAQYQYTPNNNTPNTQTPPQSAPQHNTAPNNTAQNNTAQNNTAQNNARNIARLEQLRDKIATLRGNILANALNGDTHNLAQQDAHLNALNQTLKSEEERLSGKLINIET